MVDMMKSELKFQRIMIFGRPGSGKSTFAYSLHRKTGIPVHHLDKYYFVENWVKKDNSEFLEIQQNLVNKEKWIIDGNCLASLGMRWPRADLVLYFKYPLGRCCWRVFKRLFSKDPIIDDRAEGCHEKLSLTLLRYMWSFEKRVDSQIKAFKKLYPDSSFYEITSDDDLQKVYEMIFPA